MPVLSPPETKAIPKYNLQHSSTTGSTMFEIIEAKGQLPERQLNFLEPHRRDYYMMVLMRKGNNRHWVDFVPYNVKPDTFYFTVPHQVHLKESVEPMHGFILCFTSEFLQLDENSALRQLPIIKNPYNGHEINLTPADLTFIDDTMRKMLAEFDNSGDWRNQMLQAYLRVLLIYLSRMYTEQFTGNDQFPDKVLLKSFQRLIEDNYRLQHTVAAYADMLNITPGYLNDVVKQQGGKTAIVHIHERLMVEAKRLLMHSGLSVKQIAAQLGFEDAAYFNRFFKRLADSTPIAYRTKIREMYS